MTIARRLMFLMAVPLLVLAGLGLFASLQLARIETRSRFVSETQIGSLAALGNITRIFAELRVNLRSYLLSSEPAELDKTRAAFRENRASFPQLLRAYADNLVSDDKDRRSLEEYRDLSGQWVAGAEKVMSLADA